MKTDIAMPLNRIGPQAGALGWPDRDSLMVLLIVAAGVAAMALLDPYSVKLLGKVFALWIVVLGLQLLVSHAGVITLGHAAFVAAGGYVAGGFSLAGVHPLWLMLAAVVAASAVFGGVVGAAVLRTRGLYQLMATLAIGQMVFYGFQSLRSLGGDDGFALTVRPSLPVGLTMESDGTLGLVIVALAALCAWAIHRLRTSELGVLMQAARDDERRVASLGASPYLVKLAAFVVSAVFAGLGGAMLAHLSRFTSPQVGHWMMSGELVVLVLLGGGRTRAGSFVACAAVVTVQEVLSRYTDHWPLALGILVLGRVLWPAKDGAHA
jgi:branched-chain amino acid transport system permease protein